MSETYARGSQEETTVGGVILLVTSLLAAVLVIAGLIYGAGAGERNKATLAAAWCEPNLSPSGLPCTTVQMLTSRYIRITASAVQQLNTAEAAYTANERHHLASAEAALTAEVTSDNAFDTSLARFPFPPAVAPVAKALIRANQVRAKLTAEQARSSSLTQLRSFNARVKAASATAQTEMKLIRTAIETRPPANQEP